MMLDRRYFHLIPFYGYTNVMSYITSSSGLLVSKTIYKLSTLLHLPQQLPFPMDLEPREQALGRPATVELVQALQDQEDVRQTVVGHYPGVKISNGER
jgi:hypothetical protein